MLSRTGWVTRGLVLLAMGLAAASLTTSGEWGEEGTTYAELGSDVALTCPGANPSSGTRWQWNEGSGLPNDSRVWQGQLLLSHVDLSSEGLYSCQDGGGRLLASVALRVGRVPGPPYVSCRASNYDNFSCFWTPSIETHLPTRYITSYLMKHPSGGDKSRSPASAVGRCVQDPSLPLSCTVSKSQFWSSYRVNVTEVNPLGSSFTLLDIIAHSITKPDPPEHIRVEPVPLAPRRLRVSWEYPSSWPREPYFQLHFRLRYRPLLHDAWSMVETSNMSEVITDAIIGLEHTVQVSAKDFLDAGSWSEWSPEVRGWPAAGRVAKPSEAAPDTVELDPSAEEPSPAPDEPVGHGDSLEKIATLVSLGVFAFFALVALLLSAFLVWIRAKKQSKEADKHQELLAAATHLKALPTDLGTPSFGCGKGSVCTGSPGAPVAALSGQGVSADSHSCPHHLEVRLLQCSLHEATFEKCSEISNCAECSRANGHGPLQTCPYLSNTADCIGYQLVSGCNSKCW